MIMKTISYCANQTNPLIDRKIAIEIWLDDEGYKNYTVYDELTGESATRDDLRDAIAVLKRRIKLNELQNQA